MSDFIQYDPNTGKIKHSGSCPEKLLTLQNIEGLTRLDVVGNRKTDYVDLDTLEIKPKTTFNLTLNKTTIDADGIDTITSNNVPLGTVLLFDGEKYIIDDRELGITLDVVGLYELKLSYPQYLDEVIEIEGI